MPCSSPPDGVITPPSGESPGPSPSGGHEKHPGLAAARLTFVFQRRQRPIEQVAISPRAQFGIGGQPAIFFGFG
jgi:hypothetical protein